MKNRNSNRSHAGKQRRASASDVRHRNTKAYQSKQTPSSKAKPLIYKVQEPAELLPFLLEHLPMGRNAVKSVLARGQVSVDGDAATKFNHPLLPGQHVSVSREKIEEEIPLAGLVILHEDEDILVVQKEAGLLSIASEQENEITAYRQLTDHVRRNNPAARIFIVHRLDRDTSGVMMFAKNEEAQQKLQNNWQDMVKERKYIALVEGKVKKTQGTIRSWLKETKTFKMYSSHRENDGQLAVTNFRLLQSNHAFSLLEVQLETGRKNQIRVHMEDLGHPIVGDKKYSAKSRILGRLGLHAHTLTFEHPITGEVLSFTSPIPKAFLKPFKED